MAKCYIWELCDINDPNNKEDTDLLIKAAGMSLLGGEMTMPVPKSVISNTKTEEKKEDHEKKNDLV